jgi:hypothetical protein
MRGRTIRLLIPGMLVCLLVPRIQAQETAGATPDTAQHAPVYDPFGPESSPDHTGQGSGGVLTPSPFENLIQTYFTRINADYYGVQYMLDSPLQIAVGSGWSAYQTHNFGFLMKLRTSGFREQRYDSLRDENVPYYFLSSEGSFEYPYRENGFRAFKFRLHGTTEAEGLSMPGVGVINSTWNLLLESDRPMGRKLDAEITWKQIAGGYIMPLSPRHWGVNLAVGGAVDLLGAKYQTYYANTGRFLGGKIGSAGWVGSVGWNVNNIFNLAVYVGGEWGFSTGALTQPNDKIVFADVARTTIYLGLQATGRWFNIVAGIQKEWEYIEFQSTEDADRALRYYLGASIYFRR